MSRHPAITPGRVAVITGAASGIGLAAATRFAGLGLKVCLADLPGAALDAAAQSLAAIPQAADVLAVPTDVSDAQQVEALKRRVFETFGEVAVLMNNAASEGGGKLFAPREAWRRTIETNLWGVLNGVQAFVPDMVAQGTPCAIVNTGSKQGITCPPGDTAYNVSKAGVKIVTEALAHDLRNRPATQVTAHLLIPGFTYTGFARARGITEKPAGAWTPGQVVDFMMDGLGRGDFYILCPDNETDRARDEKRIAWAAGDIIENRPALSRWHPGYEAAFAAFMKD